MEPNEKLFNDITPCRLFESGFDGQCLCYDCQRYESEKDEIRDMIKSGELDG